MAPSSVTWKLLIIDLLLKEIVDYLDMIRYSARFTSVLKFFFQQF